MYFIIGIDIDDDINELGMLEFIHNMVETLDKYFENVCELDVSQHCYCHHGRLHSILDRFSLINTAFVVQIMFNIEKAHFIIDEMVMSGYIVETNKTNILNPVVTVVKAS